MQNSLIIDGVCHPYNFSPQNIRGRFGEKFAQVMHSFHPNVNPPGHLTPEEWYREWGVEDFIGTMLLESETDICCVHTLPIYDAFEDGLVDTAKGRELKERFPDRVLWYAGIDMFQDRDTILAEARECIAAGCDGIKLYPSRYVDGFTEAWRMDDRHRSFALFEMCQKAGINNIAVHKVLPLGPVSSDGMGVDDISAAANNFPEMNFQIVHAGFMFVDETKMLMMNHPNVYATMEASMLFTIINPMEQARLLGEFIGYGSVEQVIYASAAVNPHPQRVIEAFQAFLMPAGAPPLTDDMKALILGNNLARLHGIDPAERKAKLAQDAFSKVRSSEGLRPYWSHVRGEQAIPA